MDDIKSARILAELLTNIEDYKALEAGPKLTLKGLFFNKLSEEDRKKKRQLWEERVSEHVDQIMLKWKQQAEEEANKKLRQWETLNDPSASQKDKQEAIMALFPKGS